MDVKWTKFWLNVGSSVVISFVASILTGFSFVLLLFIFLYINLGMALIGAFHNEYDLKLFSDKLFKLTAIIILLLMTRILIGIIFPTMPFDLTIQIIRMRFGMLSQSPLPHLYLPLMFDFGIAGVGLLLFIGWMKGTWGKDLVCWIYLSLVLISLFIASILRITQMIPTIAMRFSGWGTEISRIIADWIPAAQKLSPLHVAGFLLIAAFIIGLMARENCKRAAKTFGGIARSIGLFGLIIVGIMWLCGLIKGKYERDIVGSKTPACCATTRVPAIYSIDNEKFEKIYLGNERYKITFSSRMIADIGQATKGIFSGKIHVIPKNTISTPYGRSNWQGLHDTGIECKYLLNPMFPPYSLVMSTDRGVTWKRVYPGKNKVRRNKPIWFSSNIKLPPYNTGMAAELYNFLPTGNYIVQVS